MAMVVGAEMLCWRPERLGCGVAWLGIAGRGCTALEIVSGRHI